MICCCYGYYHYVIVCLQYEVPDITLYQHKQNKMREEKVCGAVEIQGKHEERNHKEI